MRPTGTEADDFEWLPFRTPTYHKAVPLNGLAFLLWGRAPRGARIKPPQQSCDSSKRLLEGDQRYLQRLVTVYMMSSPSTTFSQSIP